MMWRKLYLLRSGQTVPCGEVMFGLQHMDCFKHFTIENLKKYEHKILVTTVRSYVISANFLKIKYHEVKNKIKNMTTKSNINGEKKEISKFLKIIGEYKSKIREIRHKIKREENL